MLSTIDNRINKLLIDSFIWYKWEYVDPKKTRYGMKWKEKGNFNLSRLTKNATQEISSNTTINGTKTTSNIVTRHIEDFEIGDRVHINGKDFTITGVRKNEYPDTKQIWFIRLFLNENTGTQEATSWTP